MTSNFEAISGSLNITKTRGSRSSKFSFTPTYSQLSNDSSSSSSSFLNPSKKLSNDTNTTNKRILASHNCLKCNKEYQYIGALKTHLINVHHLSAEELNEFEGKIDHVSIPNTNTNGLSQKEPYACEFCSRIFQGEKWLVNHIATRHAILIQSPHLSRIQIPNSSNSIDSSFYHLSQLIKNQTSQNQN